jgi:hypothetical protein
MSKFFVPLTNLCIIVVKQTKDRPIVEQISHGFPGIIETKSKLAQRSSITMVYALAPTPLNQRI